MRIKTLLLVTVLCLALAPVVPSAPAQDPAPPPPPAGPMVGLSLIVTDKDGKGVNTIRKDQIRVVEEGVDQTVLGIEADERPVDYVIVFDASGSTKRFLLAVLDAAKLLIQNRRPEDQVAIVRFVNSDTIEKVHEFSSDVTSLLKELDSSAYVGGGQSAVVDALYLSAQYVAEQNKANDARRKAVVIMTDGEDRSSYYTQEKLVKLLRETGAQVFLVGLVIDLDQHGGSFARTSPRYKAEKLLNTVAEESGGRVFYPTDKKELVAATTQIILDLRAQFRIKYQSTRDASKNGFRKVDVTYVAAQGDEKRNLITPRGYFVGPRTPDKKSEKKKKS